MKKLYKKYKQFRKHYSALLRNKKLTHNLNLRNLIKEESGKTESKYGQHNVTISTNDFNKYFTIITDGIIKKNPLILQEC